MSPTKKQISLGETVLTRRVREKMCNDEIFIDFVHHCLDKHSHGSWEKPPGKKKNAKQSSTDIEYASAYIYPGDHTKIRITTETGESSTVVRIAD